MGFIKKLFQDNSLSQEPKGEEQEIVNSAVDDFTIVRCSHTAGIILILAAITQLVLTLIFPVSDPISVIGVYARNISSVVCLASLGLFMLCWCGLIIEQTDIEEVNDEKDADNDGSFRFVILFACILSVVKGLYSAGLALFVIRETIFRIAYYSIDAMGWLAVALFLWQIYRLLFTSKMSLLDSDTYRKFVMALIVIFVFKAVVSVIYMMLTFSPGFLPWIYYLADTLSWSFLAFFFSLYRNSWIALGSEGQVP